MPKQGGRANYTAISLPKELMEEVKKLMEEHPELQYRSQAEFVKDAIRRGIERYKQTEKIKQLGLEIGKLDGEQKKELKRKFREIEDLIINPKYDDEDREIDQRLMELLQDLYETFKVGKSPDSEDLKIATTKKQIEEFARSVVEEIKRSEEKTMKGKSQPRKKEK